MLVGYPPVPSAAQIAPTSIESPKLITRWSPLAFFSFAMLHLPIIASADDLVDYSSQIKPLLSNKCYACHGVLKQEGGLRLETRTLMISGGDSGAAFEAGDAPESLLLQRIIADEDSRMPPSEEGARLKPSEVDLIRRWIDQGASAPDGVSSLGSC